MLVTQRRAHAVIQEARHSRIFGRECFDRFKRDFHHGAEIKRHDGGGVHVCVNRLHADDVARHRKAENLLATILLNEHALGRTRLHEEDRAKRIAGTVDGGTFGHDTGAAESDYLLKHGVA